jgi:P27 family predicted phage terminase small subunit
MPRTKKPAGQAVDSRNGRRAELVLTDAGQLQRFDLPPRRPAWLAESRAAWEGAWADPISQAWTAADRPILLRWIDAVDRAMRALRRGDRKPVVVGGNGQITEHPSYGTAARSVATAEKCEAQLGFGALNREKLGFTIATARKSLDDLNGELAEALSEPDPDLD